MKCVSKTRKSWRVFYLLTELRQCRWIFGHAFVGMRFDLVGSEHVAVEQELTHELLPVVDPQVRVGVVRRRVVGGVVHYVLRVLHQIGSHLRQLLHVLHVRLTRTSNNCTVTYCTVNV